MPAESTTVYAGTARPTSSCWLWLG